MTEPREQPDHAGARTERSDGGGASGRPDGRKLRWARHNEERRQLIIDAALEVVEAHPPGAPFHVQEIADRCGLGRTAIYRHFADRNDLDRAVRAAIVEMLAAELLPEVNLEGTVPDIIERAIARYVKWAVAHPALHRLAESDPVAGDGPLQRGLEQIAEQVAALVRTAVEALALPLSSQQRRVVDPLAFGLVGAVFSAVRRWLATEGPRAPSGVLVAGLTDSVWYLLAGHARSLGITLRREQAVQELLQVHAAPPVPVPAGVRQG
jgi:AcrR family transcriptional regulator